MLIEFRFKNYRSFRDEATLSMEATGLDSVYAYSGRYVEQLRNKIKDE